MDLRGLATVFKALSDETRLQIMALLLREKELCVCDVMEVLQISQTKASRHLRCLYIAGLVKDRREAIWVHYRVSDELDTARARVVEALRETLPKTVVPGKRQKRSRVVAGGDR
jgi:ArsR family transcriptional regulator